MVVFKFSKKSEAKSNPKHFNIVLVTGKCVKICRQYVIDLKMPYLLIIAWECFFYLKTVKKSREVLLYTQVPLKSVWHTTVHTQPCLPSPVLYQPQNCGTIPSLSPQGSLFWSDKTLKPGMKGRGVKFHEETWLEVLSHSESPEIMFAAKFLFQRGFFFSVCGENTCFSTYFIDRPDFSNFLASCEFCITDALKRVR